MHINAKNRCLSLGLLTSAVLMFSCSNGLGSTSQSGGGSSSLGGRSGSDGANGSGGASGGGGAFGSGGVTGAGGSSAVGEGVSGTTGSSSLGGTRGSGGANGSGDASGSEASANGGTAGQGGGASGGSFGSGGVTGAGGSSATGGSSVGGGVSGTTGSSQDRCKTCASSPECSSGFCNRVGSNDLATLIGAQQPHLGLCSAAGDRGTCNCSVGYISKGGICIGIGCSGTLTKVCDNLSGNEFSGNLNPSTGGSGGSATTGGAISTGGASAGGGATGTSTMTLAQACVHNCALASGLTGCSTTQDVCVQGCMSTFDNTSAVNPDLGQEYTNMIVCVATDPSFASSADFVCAKPNSPLNLWSPAGLDLVPNSTCEDDICSWTCDDATHGDVDPWVAIRCTCSSVH
jgi:hypothetical protein